MKELRNAILKRFVLFFLLLSVIVSLLDSFAFEYGQYFLAGEHRIYAVVIGAISQIVAVALFSYLFYRSIDKKITEKSQQIAKEQNVLFANIAHDLKTPLTSINGFSKALYENVATTSEEKEELALIIHQKSQAANELLDLMFQYTKLHSEDFKLKQESLDLNYLLKETVAEIYDTIEDYSIELELQIPEDTVIRLIDKTEMKRVFINLIVNACRHNPAGTTLMIAVKEHEGQMLIIFADNGTPIPEVQQEQLFKPFVSENQTERNFHGSGLGLAISKSIVEKHGFSIGVKHEIVGYTKEFVITV
ncbi:sensor histidine kinase [Candidatus Enterococcus clewellii]|uniref:histidine kinase n=1 Tax=Candidatus Enterococcus clewellii TaxID=1834193 RepID=A0A242K1I5_9ENTE|nr:HAMP domain-containing sensor histidine kinase [Enterococcus sp. 9E7_DIV0242]OTP11521.1 hypothetical protein A5888_003620 [Enterococcus sp. 9E7_DIV0242]